MKPSKYNYIVPFGEKHVFFNGITQAFFMVSNDHKDAYQTILANPDDNESEFQAFIEKMKVQGFILDDETDEIDMVKKKYHALRCPEQYFLMVLPTYQCNLRCWYCIQNHEDLYMSDETFARVKKLIERKVSDDSVKDFHLSWFGGEPLMEYDKVLELTRFSQNLCNKIGKTFSSAITTNGTLLNPERIEELRDAGVVYYQITIDGDKDTHNSVKVLGKASAYDRTLDNINLIASHTHVNLRFNYTKDNLKPDAIIESLKPKLEKDSLKNINFTLYKVWQEDQQAVNDSDVNRLFNLGNMLGLHSNFVQIGLCYVDHVNYDCVFPNGRVGKCDNHNPNEMPGEITSDGNIEWREDMSNYYSPHLYDGQQKECDECKYLPICWGPCTVKRERMLMSGEGIHCYLQDKDEHMHRLILNTCKNILRRTEVHNSQRDEEN